MMPDWRFWKAKPPSRLDHLRLKTWQQRHVPESMAGILSMLIHDELKLLEALTEDYWSDEGLIIDAGCFVGGSTMAMASGLRKRGLADRQIIHSYDLFGAEEWMRGVYFPTTAKAGDSTRAVFDHNIAAVADLVCAHEGDIMATQWGGQPVEILFIDVAKWWTICDWVTANFFPCLIPGKSIVVQQDYLFPSWTGWLHITMAHFADHFEHICDTGYNSVAFLHTKPFSPGALKPDLVGSMSRDEHIVLLDAAGAHFSGEQAEIMQSAKAHFLDVFAYDQ